MRWRTHRNRVAIQRLLTLLVLVSLSISTLPIAYAQAPIISTKWSIANGVESPPFFIDGTGFALNIDKFDFTVDMGTTGLEYDSVAFVNETLIRFNLHGKANTGTITIQANPSAFFPRASEPSNIITIDVPVPFISQTISFITPTPMVVKGKDQVPQATSSSGLPVVITSNTPSKCTIDFQKIHAVAAGTCSLTATANGDSIYSDAEPVTRDFSVLAEAAVISSLPGVPVPVLKIFGATSYDPEHAEPDYIWVKVAARDSDLIEPKLLKLLVPPGATDQHAVFLISSFGPDEVATAGYSAFRIRLVSDIGEPIGKLKKTVEINIPSGPSDGFPSWSLDGLSWHKLTRVMTEALPADLHAGYFIEPDGRIAILTDYLMLFGFRKDQASLAIPSSARSISVGAKIQISAKGGSGDGAVTFESRTEDICSISKTGLVSGLKAGDCMVRARKEATGAYADAISANALITITPKPGVTVLPDVDQFSDMCHEISYFVGKSSSQVFVNLCLHDAGETAVLEIGTKLKTGKWSYLAVKRLPLDDAGKATFNLAIVLKKGQIIRIKVNGNIRVSATIETN